ncbi:MAG: S-layer homology domain-containing protein [Anaerolineales bacterium]|nr:S-layer homology domain-containing protein [Anaerolineales bacterium]
MIPAELAACADFTDTAGHENEVYIRYLADLGLISGFADGSFGPDNTLTRAEAATLFEISNGYDDTMLPTSAPAGCDFTDVAASDWFAGWVWQACDDGFMNGVGGGLFDPNNLLTRGQIVTIMQ